MSCIETVAPLVDYQESLVVHSYISPQDTNVVVTVGKNSPFIGVADGTKRFIDANDVFVTLSVEGGSSIRLKRQNLNRSDSANNWVRFSTSTTILPIEFGKTYYLKVTDAQLGTVQGSCTVPASRVNQSDITIKVSPGLSKTINVKWKNAASQLNYYSCTLYSSVEAVNPNATPRVINSTNLTLYLSGANQVNNLTDIGTEVPIPGTDKPYTDRSFILVSVCNTDVNYYNYNISVIRQRKEQTGNQIPEPVTIQGNLRGGLGVFGAYTQTNIRVNLL